ncbi:Gfo/Idh/MocA family oxidoreductase [Actinocrinis puniceicyclus]|uniref:Gfo/Idh/MocA family oxidoreductase n=1 Tax=Actinocrinis puniceicyclus TaxID=977794 RepID=A0A8J8BCJ6_9ACTN|nr:Gfo/Idh/MocA family oxidoreductase [Actinocrinis puniceicyclus]MBS2964238.1 Gfo/Idh/MocA family oxidoreductase [Actinocrinis puniceicyclus]
MVTELVGGHGEFTQVIAPAFAAHGQPPPTYVPRLQDAIEAARAVCERPAAVIYTPNSEHAAQVMACIAADLDVFVERPFATPAHDAPRLVAAARDADVLFFTGVQRRLEASFRYLREVVGTRRGFGELASIRCTLAVGMRPTGWRLDPGLCHGGVVIDSGYHLLDCAAWLAEAGGAEITGSTTGFVELAVDPWAPGPLETSAVGSLVGPTGVRLTFDLSYSAPVSSVFERLECRDAEGACVVVTRDQTLKSDRPGLVTHQQADGTVILDHVRLPGTPRQAAPLIGFLRSRDERASAQEHPCSARHSLTTWQLTKEIYDHAHR